MKTYCKKDEYGQVFAEMRGGHHHVLLHSRTAAKGLLWWRRSRRTTVRKGWVAGKMKVQRVVSKCMQTENWRQEKKVWRSRRSASAANVRFNLVWEQNCVSRKMRGQIYTGRCQSGHRTCFTQKMYSCLHMQNICCSGSKYFAGSRLFCRNIVTFEHQFLNCHLVWTFLFDYAASL